MTADDADRVAAWRYESPGRSTTWILRGACWRTRQRTSAFSSAVGWWVSFASVRRPAFLALMASRSYRYRLGMNPSMVGRARWREIRRGGDRLRRRAVRRPGYASCRPVVECAQSGARPADGICGRGRVVGCPGRSSGQLRGAAAGALAGQINLRTAQRRSSGRSNRINVSAVRHTRTHVRHDVTPPPTRDSSRRSGNLPRRGRCGGTSACRYCRTGAPPLR